MKEKGNAKGLLTSVHIRVTVTNYQHISLNVKEKHQRSYALC